MIIRFLLSLSALMLISTNFSYSAPLTENEKIHDFEYLNSLIESGYGPLLYKSEKGIADYPILRQEYLAKIKATKSNSEYYYAIVQYVAAFKDGHFSARLPTNYTASLGIFTELIDNKVVISSIDRKKHSESEFSFSIGDEIVTVDGVPVQTTLDQIQSYLSSGNPNSSRRQAAWLIFFRPARVLPVPANKESIFTIRRGQSNIIESVTLKWTFEGEFIDEQPDFYSNSLRIPFSITPRMNYDLLATDQNDFSQERLDRNYKCSATTRINIPKDATRIMDTPFVAYYHPTQKGNVGYLRIPHYSPDETSSAKWYDNYEYAIQKLEANTVGLIIDQDHNCGGSVILLEKMVGLFMDKPYSPTLFKLMGNKAEYLKFKEWMKESEKTIYYDLLQNVLNLIKTTWLNNEYLTPLTSITGIKNYQPNPIHYTKPIVMLIDDQAGSGGDAFPSLMQGFGRATLLGSRTAGLGGHVEEQPPLPYSQLSVRMTKSLFFRPDGVPVENNGASPDIEYQITRDDLLYGYKPYQDFYLNELFKKLP